MTFTDRLPQWLDRLSAVGHLEILVATALAVVAGSIGTALIRRRLPLGRLLRLASTLTLAGVLLTVVLQVSSFDPRLGAVRAGLGADRQVVAGEETRIRLARDGHFWINAEVNGERARFLVDTGATLTAVSEGVARRAGLEARPGGGLVRIVTANGAVPAQLTRIETLTFGNVEADNIDAVIATTLGETNVLGMNFLSRLEGWRVEGDTLILNPASRDVAEPAEAA